MQADDDVLADVEVYLKAGHFLHEFPPAFFTKEDIDQALAVLDQGLERARQLKAGRQPWFAGDPEYQ